ncbi:MAG: YihY family inner membrane protein [Succinivibrio sp.]|nr:YihY family inner membrane protein [Succinivibrio sp.]
MRRIKRDNIALEAGALAYTSLLSLIPAFTVILSIFAVIPAFKDLRDSVSGFAAKNFMPVFTEAITSHVGSLVEHAGKLTVTSTIALFIVSLLLVRSIDHSLNRIWRGGRRKVGTMIAIYWTLLTLGPLAVGMIIWLTSKVLAYALTAGQSLGISLMLVYYLTPVIIEIVVVTALFVIVPAATVKLQDAVIGAVVTTVAFEISKKVFSAFVLNFSNYEALYGALAALPVLMIWIYINWWIVLLGAEFTATLGIVRSGTSDEIPNFMVFLANATGQTLGSDSITHPYNKKARLNIRVAKRPNISN